jgi:hypothetical protein
MIYTIDELIGQHWAGCDLLRGETPEAYTLRHELTRLRRRSPEWVYLLARSRRSSEES